MSNAPYYLEKARFGYRMGPGQLQDHMLHDGLWDIVNDFHMGMSKKDVDLYEINEAFSGSTVGILKELQLDTATG